MESDREKRGRIMAIDYGTKRSGIAITDELQLIASGLTTVPTELLFDFLKQYFATEIVEKVVLGLPKKLNNEVSDAASAVGNFALAFQKNFPDIPLVFLDERFTSKIAFQSMIDSGLSKKQRQNKALVDEIAATIILQDFLKQAGC
jgi:putative Holliday junction resolvase